MPPPSCSASGLTFSPSASASAWSAFRRGDTDYRISALPLGGYVKMAGENPLEARTGAPDEFMSHPRWQRFVIALAGPAMNILLAVALLTGVFMVHYERPEFFDQPAVIGWVLDNSPAAEGRHRAGRPHRPHRWRTKSHLGRRAAEGDDQPQTAARSLPSSAATSFWRSRLSPKPKAADDYGSVGWLPEQTVHRHRAGCPTCRPRKAGIQGRTIDISRSTARRCAPLFVDHSLPAGERRQAGRCHGRSATASNCTSP